MLMVFGDEILPILSVGFPQRAIGEKENYNRNLFFPTVCLRKSFCKKSLNKIKSKLADKNLKIKSFLNKYSFVRKKPLTLNYMKST